MKKLNFFLFLTITFFTASNIYSKTWTVDATGIVFSPASISVTVGDTIKWQWVDGIHTTTSSTIPTGAATWNAPLTASNPTFSYIIQQQGTYNYYCIHHQALGMTGTINASPIGIKPISTSVPEAYDLMQNYPNPFNPVTNIRFDIPENTKVKLVVYNVQGKLIAELVNSNLNAGSYIYNWDASAIPSGVFFYTLTADNFRAVKKLVLEK